MVTVLVVLCQSTVQPALSEMARIGTRMRPAMFFGGTSQW